MSRNQQSETKGNEMSLIDYRTGETVREATDAEREASVEAARQDGGAGVIAVPDHDGPVYVED